MSNNNGLAEKNVEGPLFTTPVAPAVRPKVMRRPAQFTAPAPAEEPPLAPIIVGLHAPAAPAENENLALPQLPVPLSPASTKAWQDDMRFGIAMLSMVVLVNVALIAWLPHMRPDPAAASMASEPETAGLVTTPTDAAITFYSKPPTEPTTAFWGEEPSPAAPRSGADSGPNQ